MDRRLIFLVLVAAILRFWRLGEVPVGFHRDEAFLGYNAYSILKTGKDISGNFFPLHLASFLYSPAGYSWATIPFLAIFGLNEFAVRAPSALFGTLTVPLLYLFVAYLFGKHRHGKKIALMGAAVLAFMPWHINLSRVATEHILAVFFYVAGIWFLVWGIVEKKRARVIFSFLTFFLTLFIYQAARSFVPLVIPLVVVTYWKNISRGSLRLVVAGYAIAVLAPLIFVIASPTLSTRIRTLLPQASPEAQLVIDEGSREDGVSSLPTFLSRAFHNKVRVYTTQVVQNYFSHLTFNFFFTDRAYPDRYRIPGAGLLHLIELPILLAGLAFFIRKRLPEHILLGGWFAIGLLGSALTFDDIPNLQRTLVIVPSTAAIAGYGAVTLVGFLWRFRRITLVILLAGFGAYAYFVAYYLHQYYVHQLIHRPWFRQEGFRELVPLVNSLRKNYQRVVVTDREAAPLIFFLFYTPYDPAYFQRETRGVSLVSTTNIPFDGLTFSGEECPAINADERRSGRKATLYVNGQICKFPQEENLRILSTIKRRDGTGVFQLTDAVPDGEWVR